MLLSRMFNVYASFSCVARADVVGWKVQCICENMQNCLTSSWWRDPFFCCFFASGVFFYSEPI